MAVPSAVSMTFVQAFEIPATLVGSRQLAVSGINDTTWQSLMDDTPLSMHASAF